MEDHKEMCEVVESYFGELFGSGSCTHETQNESGARVITESQNVKLLEEFTFDEFTNAIKQMHPDKSSGPDGLNPTFFQHFWNLLGKEVYQSCKAWLRDLTFPEGLNDTNIVLILKKEHADNMRDLHPIALVLLRKINQLLFQVVVLLITFLLRSR